MKLKTLIVALFAGFSFSLVAVGPAIAYDPFSNVCSGSAANSAACQENQTNNSKGNPNPVYHLIKTAASLIAMIGGIAAVIIMMVGAINYTTSRGNSEATQKAKKRITGALIGAAIIAAAWTIVSLGIKLLE